MAPLIEHMIGGATAEYPMNQETDGTLVDGKPVKFVSTPTGGFIRSEYREAEITETPEEGVSLKLGEQTPDTILKPGEVIQLSGGSYITVTTLETPAVLPSPNDGGVV